MLAIACGAPTSPEPSPGSPPGSEPPAGEIFADLTAEVGLDFVHMNGMSGEYYFAEMMGVGGALFDADGDGDLDLYLVQGQMLPADRDVAAALFPPRHPLPLTDRLYRNELVPWGSLRFTDVTAESGLAGMPETAGGYGMGVAAGDVDNDGRVDLYVTRFGPNRLLRNLGAGGRGAPAFADVTAAAGVGETRWSVAATFFDYDRDGWLDLYVGNYVDFTLGTHKVCRDAAGAQDYCAPSAYRGVSDRLFRNAGGPASRPGHRGGGSFEDVSLETGVGVPLGPGLGALAADLDGDGWLDLYVANDGAPNFLWHNGAGHRDDGPRPRFRDTALMSGAAVDEDGRPQASMGVDAADVDNDGDLDLFMSHLTGETNALFLNLGGGEFRDVTSGSGIGTPSYELTGFGTAFIDYDNDGWLDLLVVNGAVKTIQALAAAGDPYPLRQPSLLFRNLGDGRFEDVSARAGAAFEVSEVGRGAAFGDVDNDGDVDVVVVNNNGPARLLVNRVGSGRAWIGFRLESGGRDALGARVEVLRPGRPTLWRRSRSDGSYASASDPRVLVGLGDDSGPVDVRVHWLGGEVEAFGALATGRYHTLRRGSGVAQPLR